MLKADLMILMHSPLHCLSLQVEDMPAINILQEVSEPFLEAVVSVYGMMSGDVHGQEADSIC